MQIIKKEKTQDFKILNKKTSGIPLRDNRTLFITYDEPDTLPASIKTEKRSAPLPLRQTRSLPRYYWPCNIAIHDF